MGMQNVLARVASAVRIATGFQSTAQLTFWSVQLGHVGLAAVLGGVGVLVYHKLPSAEGVASIGCGIIFSWLGSLLARPRK